MAHKHELDSDVINFYLNIYLELLTDSKKKKDVK